MDFSKKALRNLIVYLALLTGVILFDRYTSRQHMGLPFGIAVPLLLNTIYLHWLFSVRRRFPQTQMGKNITLFVAAFLVLSLIRVAKYNYTSLNSDMQRWLWLAYYVPLVFGPLFMFYASLYIGKPDDYRVSPRWNWLFLPAALLSVGILTNDFHQLAFRFGSGISLWNEDYSHGVLYGLAVAWMLLMLLGVIVMAVRSTVKRRLFKTAWLPLTVLALAALYWMQYAFIGDPYGPLQHFLEAPDFLCLFSIAMWESFVIARIVISNKDYPAVFAASSLGAGLADRDFAVRQTAAQGICPQPETLKRAAAEDLLLPDGDTLLKVRKVQGGWFYWTEDIAELLRLREKLDDTADYLTEENAMMRMASEFEEGRRVTAEQTRLYNRVTDALRPQLDRLNALLLNLPEDDGEFRRVMKTAAVLLAYAKRRSFLLLAANESPMLRGEDLRLCFEESVKALRIAEISCTLTCDPAFCISSQSAVLLYEAFERAVERSFASLRSVCIALGAETGGRTALRITLQTEADPLTKGELSEYADAFSSVSSQRSGDCAQLAFVLPAVLAEGGSR